MGGRGGTPLSNRVGGGGMAGWSGTGWGFCVVWVGYTLWVVDNERVSPFRSFRGYQNKWVSPPIKLSTPSPDLVTARKII